MTPFRWALVFVAACTLITALIQGLAGIRPDHEPVEGRWGGEP